MSTQGWGWHPFSTWENITKIYPFQEKICHRSSKYVCKQYMDFLWQPPPQILSFCTLTQPFLHLMNSYIYLLRVLRTLGEFCDVMISLRALRQNWYYDKVVSTIFIYSRSGVLKCFFCKNKQTCWITSCTLFIEEDITLMTNSFYKINFTKC